MPTGALIQKADHTFAFNYVKAGYMVCCWPMFITN
jgi:hypothetical protein